MNAKEYLSQAFYIERQINSKLEQRCCLWDLVTRTNTAPSGMPGSPNRNTDKLSRAVAKLADLEQELNEDVDLLVDLRVEITHRIKSVPDAECRILLELRYLCFKTWEEIAVELNHDIRHIYRLHQMALNFVEAGGYKCQ